MTTVLAVGLGGFVGAIARYGAHVGIARWLGAGFPYATLLVNVVGSFAFGLLAGMTESQPLSPAVRLAVGVGFLGALTTFSTFSVETIALAGRAGLPLAILSVAANVTLAISAAAAGLALTRP